jgi:hypothetical protein
MADAVQFGFRTVDGVRVRCAEGTGQSAPSSLLTSPGGVRHDPTRSSPVWAAVRTSIPASTRFAPPRRSRPPHRRARRADCGLTRSRSASSRLPRTIPCPTQSLASFTLLIASARSPTSSRGSLSRAGHVRHGGGAAHRRRSGSPDTDAAVHAALTAPSEIYAVESSRWP